MSFPGPVAPCEETELAPTQQAFRGLPLPWLLALLAAAVWYPLEPFWQSDDFIALHYARDFGNVLADFANPQYGATDLWWFYRPFITLSFWLDNQISGAAPFVPHLANATIHGASAMLVGLIWARFLTPGSAWVAGLLWGLAPAHAGSILWTAGRVDVFASFWCLLSLWLLCRWREGRARTAIWSLVAFVVALGCKELAFVLPGLALLLCFCLAEKGRRFKGALHGAAPYFLILGLFLVWRFYALGVIVGGYDGFSLQPAPMLQGLGRTTAHLLNPLFYAGEETQAQWLGAGLPSGFVWIGLLPATLAAFALVLRKRLSLLALIVVAFVGICIPMMPFWAASLDVKNLRYFYLPFAVLVGLIAAGGTDAWVLAALVWLTPLVEIRTDYRDMHGELQAMHQQLLADTTAEDGELFFVAGLPRVNDKGNVLGFHHGVDRLLSPPFGPGQHRVFALRPLVDIPSVYTLDNRENHALPEGITLAFEGGEILSHRLQTMPLPDLRVRLDAPQLLTYEWLMQLARREVGGALVMEGVHTSHYRITVFTAGGYMAAIAPDRSPPGRTDGRVELFDLFNTDGRYAGRADALLTTGLQVPITMDLSRRFPVLVEAGHMVDVLGRQFFAPTHSSRRFLWFEFDQLFPQFVREVQGR